MGWLVVGLSLLLILGLIKRFFPARKKFGRHRAADVEIYDRVLRECTESDARSGEFDLDLDEISSLDWLELGTHAYTKEQFKALVKWRNQGTQCIYKYVASAGEGEEEVTKSSQKEVIPFSS